LWKEKKLYPDSDRSPRNTAPQEAGVHSGEIRRKGEGRINIRCQDMAATLPDTM